MSTSRCGTGGRPTPRADCATNDSAMTEARARSSRAWASSMSISAWKPHSGAEHGERGLHVDARIAGADRQRVRLGRRQPGLERAVHEQAPHLLERHLPDELLDVDPAVAQRAALLVRLGDLGGEGDHALQARLDFAHGRAAYAAASPGGAAQRGRRSVSFAVALLTWPSAATARSVST